MDSKFLTAEKVTKYLRHPLSTVYKLVQDKVFSGFKVGKHWRFRREKNLGWIKQKEEHPANLTPQNPKNDTLFVH